MKGCLVLKTYGDFFQKKNTKRGLALSTTMAICIVLAILVAMLVSMATLNITMTQDTVYQREAYIQAKSALSFVESYYKLHGDEIPGIDSGSPGGEALVVFNGNSIADGAKIYVTKTDSATYTPGWSDAAVEDMKKDAPDAYVEVVNTVSTLIATAYCKYGENDSYELSKEFDLSATGTGTPPPFTGNVTYEPTSDTRYLRIHVRTSEAFGQEPYTYVYGSPRNSSEAVDAKGGSSLVNKLSGDSQYPDMGFSGKWDETGPTEKAAMQYEGNGWYVTELEISTQTAINYVTAIVTQKEAKRADGDKSQSWEFFGIPVPQETGEENGADVYITLNQKELKDARNTPYWGYDYHDDIVKDDLTTWFKSTYHADVDEFAQFSGKWYTVYTKKDTAYVHYRKAGVYDDTAGIGGFTYEGYGWWRDYSHNFGDSVTISGTTYSYGDGAIISQNEYGKEVVRELFVCEDAMGNTASFGSEAEANKWFVEHAGDVDADDYVTINVRANEQPVDSAVTTTIEYTSEVINGINNPAPGPAPDVSSDTDSDKALPQLGEATNPTITKVSNTVASDKLNIQTTAATVEEIQPSGATGDVTGDYGVAGTFNDWGIDGSESYYDLIDYMDPTGGYGYSITYTDLEPGTYEFKIIEKVEGYSEIQWNSHSWGNGGGNYSFSVSELSNATITFDRNTKAINVSITGAGGGSDKTYSVIGWLNDWGRNGGAGDHYYQNLADMTDNGDGTFSYTLPTLVDGGNTYDFKIVEKLVEDGSLEANGGWDSSHCFGGGGTDGNYTIDLTSGAGNKYSITITFNENSKHIDVTTTLADVDGGSYYLVGTFNEWANHQFDEATAYPLELVGVDGEGNFTYKYNIGRTYPGDYEVKVVSSAAKLDPPDEQGKTIDYNESWGKADGTGITLGSDKAAFSYPITEVSDVEITFTFNPTNRGLSRITYLATPYDSDEELYTMLPVGFYNNQLVNANDPSVKTNFTTPWESVYVTYLTDRAGLESEEVIMTSGSDIVWAYVPSDAEYIYFSNGDTAARGTAGYEYTDNIPAAWFATITNPVFFPKNSSNAEFGVLWTMGDSTEYANYAYTVSNFSETAEMVYTGSNQNNYYDVPMVRVLLELVGAGSRKYVFSAHCYSGYGLKGCAGGGSVTFNPNQYVVYQGEKYYYKEIHGGDSCLIVQSTDGSRGGYLMKNDMALISDYWGIDKVKMDNRGGAVFTSDGTYYNGDASPFSYGGYAPSWYTYKIHATTSYTIKNLKGVTNAGTGIINGNNTPTQVVKADSYYNQPLYIYNDADGSRKVYTYNIDTGKVDTSSSSKVSVYFNNSAGWVDVRCYAFGIGDTTVADLSIDSTNADNSYYKFEFDAGKYAYFVFYDAKAKLNDNSEIGDRTDKLNEISEKTGVLYMTGEENDSREYAILADGQGATEFSFFLHPRTQALYAFQEARAAFSASKVYAKYTYDSSTQTYHEVGDTLSMSELQNKMDAAKNYYEHGSGGKWSASGSGSYSELADAARVFTDAITDARIYIAEEDPAHPVDSNYIFPEGDYRDSVLSYKERWVKTLKNAYNNAMGAYSNTGLQNASSLYSLADEINAIIANPESVLAPDAVQIIIDDQLDSAGNGHWGKENIKLYHLYTGTWVDSAYKIYDTTQTDYYAFAFKLDYPGDEYCVVKNGVGTDTAQTRALEEGKHYMFHTASGEFEEYDHGKQTTITIDEIKEGGAYSDWSTFQSDVLGEEFELYFKYDTEVDGMGYAYTIRAGKYLISSGSYSEFNTQFTGATGINLFTAEAKAFFTNPSKYGMSHSSTTDYEEWRANKPNDANDKDIMCDSIANGSDTIFARAAENRRVNFRYNGAKGHDELKLNRDVELEAGVVSMAVNKLNLNAHKKDFVIKSSTVVFYTDVEVTTKDGTKYIVLHGTYICDTSAGATPELNFNDKTWVNKYILIDEMESILGGGKFVAK